MYIIGNNVDYVKALYTDYSSLYSDFIDFIRIKDDCLFDTSGKQVELKDSKAIIAVTEPKHKIKAITVTNKYSYNMQYDSYKVGYGLLNFYSNGNIIGRNVHIDHNTSLGDYNTIGHNTVISYSTKIGNFNNIGHLTTIMNNCYLGNMNNIAGNVNISEFITIGDNCVITPGECLFEDLENNKKFQSGIIFKQ